MDLRDCHTTLPRPLTTPRPETTSKGQSCPNTHTSDRKPPRAHVQVGVLGPHIPKLSFQKCLFSFYNPAYASVLKPKPQCSCLASFCPPTSGAPQSHPSPLLHADTQTLRVSSGARGRGLFVGPLALLSPASLSDHSQRHPDGTLTAQTPQIFSAKRRRGLSAYFSCLTSEALFTPWCPLCSWAQWCPPSEGLSQCSLIARDCLDHPPPDSEPIPSRSARPRHVCGHL